ncbi:MAG: NAD-dependent epimerase/dehydratase family protein [Nannocystaceae bacterium]
MRKVVITGGAGFIGSHLCDALLAVGVEVAVVDNFVTGKPENLRQHQGNELLTVHEVTIGADADLRPIFSGADAVFHLAALADIVPSIERPIDYLRANVDATVLALEAARSEGVGRFIYAASSSCYGIPETYPTAEDAPCRPAYPYALTKYLAEQAVCHWHQVYALATTCLRLFNVYGSRSRTQGSYGAMFGVFLAQKLAGKPYTVVGDGEQCRDFTHVTDVVDAFLKVARARLPDVTGEVFNVGTGVPVSVRRVAELLGGPCVHIPTRPGEPQRTQADTKKLRKTLGWVAKVTIEEGVAGLLADLRTWKDAPVWTPSTISAATESWFRYLGDPPHARPA